MVHAILQARVSSTRLPGKVLKPILGHPMLQRQLERIQRAKSINRLTVATSNQADDQPIVDLCRNLGVSCFQGSLDDVLDRFYRAAVSVGAEHIVRLTGDCPLADPEVIDRVVGFFIEGGFDYASNTIEPTFPDGLDVEVFGFSSLETAWREAKLGSHREHVTPFIWQQPNRFNVASYKGERDLSNMRWTVDEPEDLEFVRAVYDALYPIDPGFSTSRILEYLVEHPDLAALNDCYDRNEGLTKSQTEDRLRTTS